MIESMTVMDIVTLSISIFATVFAAFTYWSNIIHDRKQATLEAYNQLQEQALDRLYVYMPKELELIAKNRRSEEFKEVGTYVARIEHFAVGVNQKIYDEKIVYELSHGFLDGGIKTRVEIIIAAKEESFNEEYYHNIKVLYLKMDAETQKRNNK